MKCLLVASSGGHLLELFALRAAWAGQECTWVTFPTADAESLLGEEARLHWAHHPTNRNLPNLLRNIGLAWTLLRRDRPDVVISTGAGVGVPFIWLGALFGIETIFVESITFTDRPSLSARLVYPFVDRYFVQWPMLAQRYAKAQYRGQVL